MNGQAWLQPSLDSLEAVNALACDPVLARRRGRAWWLTVGASLALTALFVWGAGLALSQGVGVWGNNTMVVWGFPIANYVWWIGVGNAGTLISSLLLITRQRWRASISRFAEAMTIVAVSVAGIFPIIHLGRPMYFYWNAPYPSTTHLWPQWRSALVWDFWAILSYLLFSIVFFYTGLIPDFATLRDRAHGWFTKRAYGVLALGWRGSLRHWSLFDRFQRMMAIMAVPLVCSVHSIVGLDFAATLMPGWSESLFPPYFVVGALFSGFAMVALLAAGLRRSLGLESAITPRHFDAMAKIILASGCFMGLSYATEAFGAWYGGVGAEHRLLSFTFVGPYAPLYVTMLACNVLAPQLFWVSGLRRDLRAVIAVSVAVLIGMWLERILIIANTLSHGYVPSGWRLYWPTLIDGAVLAGSAGLFLLLMLLFSRFLPVLALYELRAETAREGRR